MTGFPTLKPFATICAQIDQPNPIGTLCSGPTQFFVSIKNGTLTTEPGVEPALKTTLVMGGDWLLADPDLKHLRLDMRSVIKTEDDVHLTFSFKGIINVTPDIAKILQGEPDAESIDFGNILALPQFQTGHEKYKYLENLVFVASGRAIVGEGGVTVEYKVSQVVA
ncbi:hypothetical protein BDD12DRAFT_829250 [Trichophaea hybrida]|nr:hypothetical protein BDD12DRAFT_829250 [Trichophaea hybrida]